MGKKRPKYPFPVFLTRAQLKVLLLMFLTVTLLPAAKDYLSVFPMETFLGGWEKYYCCQDVENILLNRECTSYYSQAKGFKRWLYPCFELGYLVLTRIIPSVVLLQIFKFGAIKNHRKIGQSSLGDSESPVKKKAKSDHLSGPSTHIS